jgi:hypothetical protein
MGSSVSKAIRRVIPKEIQPILPIAASMFGGPLVGKALGSAFGTGIMSTLGGKALASGLTSAGVDLLTKGKVDPRTAAVSALMGGGGQYFKNVGQGGQFLGMELGDKAKSAFTDLGSLLAPTEVSESGKFQLSSGIGEDEVLGSLAQSAGTAATVGGTISAYDAAEEAQRKYEEEMAGREADAAADRQSRIDYITRYMGMAGFSQAEIDDALSRYGYKTGGRVGFSSGGSGTLGDSMQDIKILLMKNQIIEAGGGGFGGKDLDDKTDDEIIEIYESLFSQGKANGGRIGYRIGGGPVKSFIAKLLNAEPSEEVLDRMFEERKKEIFNSMFDPEAGTGAYSMEQMQKADEMATKQAMQELEEYKMRIGMEMENPPEGTVGSDIIEQIMEPRKEGRVKEAKGGRIKKSIGGLAFMYRDYLEGANKYDIEPVTFEEFTEQYLDIKREEGDTEKYKKGGRIKYAEGGSSTEQQKRENYFDLKRDEFMSLSEYLLSPMSDADLRKGKAEGGIMNLKMGGMPAEMDLRGGGFVPIGAKEKADDVPARLSKNEFVMTADAVRAAGGGSVNKGAKRMYDLMNKLEARV